MPPFRLTRPIALLIFPALIAFPVPAPQPAGPTDLSADGSHVELLLARVPSDVPYSGYRLISSFLEHGWAAATRLDPLRERPILPAARSEANQPLAGTGSFIRGPLLLPMGVLPPSPGGETPNSLATATELDQAGLESSTSPGAGPPARPVMMPAIAWVEGGVEHITAPDGVPMVSPRAMDFEYLALMNLAKKTTTRQIWQASFLLPVQAPVSTHFGTHRAYGPAAASPHLGVDLAGRAGAAVIAANSGVVAFSGVWQVRGNAVVIDHGLGVYSGYYHLADLRVKEGQAVDRGEIIGAVGATGLATGPHVHWDLVVRGRHVSPLEWVDPRETGPFGNDPAAWPVIADVPVTPVERPAADMPRPEVSPPSDRALAAGARPEPLPDVDRDTLVRRIYEQMLGRNPVEVREDELRLWAGSAIPHDELPAAIAAAGRSERTQAVRGLYVQLLGRDPAQGDVEGLQSWVVSPLSLSEVRAQLLAAGAGEREAAIRRIYLALLDRDPANGDSTSLHSWVEGGLALAEIQAILAASPEAQARASTKRQAAPATQPQAATPVPSSQIPGTRQPVAPSAPGAPKQAVTTNQPPVTSQPANPKQ